MGTLIKIGRLSVSELESQVILYLNKKGERQGCDIVRDVVDVKVGSIYVVLQRLENKKLLSSRQDTAFSGYGPLPRFWALTERGRQVCKVIVIITQLSSAQG